MGFPHWTMDDFSVANKDIKRRRDWHLMYLKGCASAVSMSSTLKYRCPSCGASVSLWRVSLLYRCPKCEIGLYPPPRLWLASTSIGSMMALLFLKSLYERGLSPACLAFLLIVLVAATMTIVNYLVFVIGRILIFEARFPCREIAGLNIETFRFILCVAGLAVLVVSGTVLLLFGGGRESADYMGRFFVFGGLYMTALLTTYRIRRRYRAARRPTPSRTKKRDEQL